MAEKKPVKVFYSGLTNTIYATASYRDRGDGLYENTGKKTDVTQDAIGAVAQHVTACKRAECVCQSLFKNALGQANG